MGFKLDISERFSRLVSAPILEATVDWRGFAQTWPTRERLEAELAARLPEFPTQEPMHSWSLQSDWSPPSDSEASSAGQPPPGWTGSRLRSRDGRFVVHFERQRLVISQVGSYENWDVLIHAALPVWQVYVALAKPMEINRLGVRFINHFPTATPDTLADILRDPPTRPADLPLTDFLYQSTFSVPSHPYGVNVVKVLQPRAQGLFLDVDAFTTRPLPNEGVELDTALSHLRWLKNKVFFSLIQDDAIPQLARDRKISAEGS